MLSITFGKCKMSSSVFCFPEKCTQDIESLTLHGMHNANDRGTYQLPVKESLVCGPLTKKQLSQCVIDITPQKETQGVPSAQQQSQQRQTGLTHRLAPIDTSGIFLVPMSGGE